MQHFWILHHPEDCVSARGVTSEFNLVDFLRYAKKKKKKLSSNYQHPSVCTRKYTQMPTRAYFSFLIWLNADVHLKEMKIKKGIYWHIISFLKRNVAVLVWKSPTCHLLQLYNFFPYSVQFLRRHSARQHLTPRGISKNTIFQFIVHVISLLNYKHH